MITSTEAIERLRRGNLRFVSDTSDHAANDNGVRRQKQVAGQSPFAVVLGCSDSRVPVEIIFDQSLGDLFVVRVAGNIVGPAQIGSIEYAVKVLGVKLVVVLGHSGCGAVKATLAEIQHPSENLSPGLQTIVSAIRPAVEALPATEKNASQYLENAVYANVNHAVQQLHEQSTTVHHHMQQKESQVVGAMYSLETGKVEFV